MSVVISFTEKQNGETKQTDPVHRQIMPDTVLPPLRLLISRLVRILNEPVINVAQNHGMPRRLQQCSINQLRIRLRLVQTAVVLVFYSPRCHHGCLDLIMRSRISGPWDRAVRTASVVHRSFDFDDSRRTLRVVLAVELQKLVGRGVLVRAVQPVWRKLGWLNVKGGWRMSRLQTSRAAWIRAEWIHKTGVHAVRQGIVWHLVVEVRRGVVKGDWRWIPCAIAGSVLAVLFRGTGLVVAGAVGRP